MTHAKAISCNGTKLQLVRESGKKIGAKPRSQTSPSLARVTPCTRWPCHSSLSCSTVCRHSTSRNRICCLAKRPSYKAAGCDVGLPWPSLGLLYVQEREHIETTAKRMRPVTIVVIFNWTAALVSRSLSTSHLEALQIEERIWFPLGFWFDPPRRQDAVDRFGGTSSSFKVKLGMPCGLWLTMAHPIESCFGPFIDIDPSHSQHAEEGADTSKLEDYFVRHRSITISKRSSYRARNRRRISRSFTLSEPVPPSHLMSPGFEEAFEPEEIPVGLQYPTPISIVDTDIRG